LAKKESLDEAKEKANIARYKSDFTDDDDMYFNKNNNEPNSPGSVSSMPIFSSKIDYLYYLVEKGAILILLNY